MRHVLPSHGKAENENNGLSTDFLDAPIRNINVGLFGKDRVTASYKTIDIILSTWELHQRQMAVIAPKASLVACAVKAETMRRQ